MANEDNLISNSERTPRERQNIASKAGRASGESRRKNKSIREALIAVLKGTYDIDGVQVQGYDAIAVRAFNEAMDGNIKAFVAIRDTIGEKPTDKLRLESSGQSLKEIKISFVDKSAANNRGETDPQIIGEYTDPVGTEDGS